MNFPTLLSDSLGLAAGSGSGSGSGPFLANRGSNQKLNRPNEDRKAPQTYDTNRNFPMNVSCFRSSQPAAVNASLLFDFHTDLTNLWERPDGQASLPACGGAAWRGADSACLVCRDRDVFAVCRSLRDGAAVMMEAMGRSVEISAADCPSLHSDEDDKVSISINRLLALRGPNKILQRAANGPGPRFGHPDIR